MEGYTLLEYIESDGTQYIDTGIVGKSGVKSVMDMALMKGGASIPLGCYSPQRCYLVSFNNDSSLRYGYVDWVTSQFIPTIGERYVIETDFSIDNQLLRVDDKTITSSSIGTSFSNNHTIYAFAYNDGGKPGDYSSLRLYSLKLYDNGILVRDYIPCMDNNGVYGLYDKVNGVFYASATDSGFTGKWAENKILNVYMSEYRRRMLNLIPKTDLPDYSAYRGVYIEDVNGHLHTVDSWNGSLTPNGIAVLADNCRFVMAVVDTPEWGTIWAPSSFNVKALPKYTSFEQIKADVDGYGNTERILSLDRSEMTIAAYCHNYIFPNGNRGYLGAFGEWYALFSYKDQFKNAIEKLGVNVSSRACWTSTMASDLDIYTVSYPLLGGYNTYNFSQDMNYFVPLTKLKFDNNG